MGIADFTSLKMRVLFVCLLVALVALTCGKTTVKKNKSDKNSNNPEDRFLFGLFDGGDYYDYGGGHPHPHPHPHYDDPQDTIDANSTATEEVKPPTRDVDVEAVVPEEEADKNKRKKNKKNKKNNKKGDKN